jgi:peptidoglycan/LPS O-acetylase OafA/YrhL
MSYYSVWPVFACMILLFLLAATPAFAAADAPPSLHPHRLKTLDGLRGFLALAVFFYHAAIYHHFLQGGGWGFLPSRRYSLIGPLGVSFFFMITGYLFWSRLLAERGRPNWVRLYIGRVFRIGPVYFIAAGAMMIFVAVQTGMHLNLPFGTVARQIGTWLGLGYTVGFDINAYGNTALVLAAVIWTLHCEWLFYFSLPVIALVARHKWLHLPFVITGLIVTVVLSQHLPDFLIVNVIPVYIMIALFLTGMLCASLHRAGFAIRLTEKISDNIASVLVVALFAGMFAWLSGIYAMMPIIVMGIAFYLIVSGCTVFGLLTSRPARRLGDVSYGIYILQGLALDAALRPAPLRAIALASPIGHWTLVFLGAVFLIMIATVAHVLIERPGIRLGKQVADLAEQVRVSVWHGRVKKDKASAVTHLHPIQSGTGRFLLRKNSGLNNLD